MAEAIAVAVVDALALEGTTAVVVAAAVEVAVNVAIAVSVGALARALAGGPGSENQKTSLNLDAAPRRVHFGQTLTGAALVYSDAVKGIRWDVWAIGHGRVVEVLEHRLDNTARFTNSQLEVQPEGRYRENVKFDYRPGDANQLVSSMMLEIEPVLAKTSAPRWTTDHRLDGIECAFVRSKRPKSEYFLDVYTNGQPPIPSTLGRYGLPLDPRTGQRVWSDNAALVVAWYLTHPDGYRLTEDDIDWDSVAVAANDFDALGFKLSGTWSLDQPRGAVLRAMQAACDLNITTGRDGRLTFWARKWQAPELHLDKTNIVSIDSIAGGFSGLDQISGITVSYTDRDQDYAEAETGIAYSPNALTTADIQRVPLAYCPLKHQAEILRDRLLAKADAEWILSIRTTLAGLEALAQPFCTLTYEALGFDHVPFEILKVRIDTATMTVSLDLVSTGPASFPT